MPINQEQRGNDTSGVKWSTQFSGLLIRIYVLEKSNSWHRWINKEMKKCLENWKNWYNCLKKLAHLVISPHIVISTTIISAGGKLGRSNTWPMKKSSSKKTYHSGTNSWEKADLAPNRKFYFNMHLFKHWFIVFKLEIIISTRGITTAKLPCSFCEVIYIGRWITNVHYLPAFSKGREENMRCKTR